MRGTALKGHPSCPTKRAGKRHLLNYRTGFPHGRRSQWNSPDNNLLVAPPLLATSSHPHPSPPLLPPPPSSLRLSFDPIPHSLHHRGRAVAESKSLGDTAAVQAARK